MLKSSVFKGHHIDLSIVSKERKKRRCMKLCKNESHPLTNVKRLIESVINNNKTVKFCLLFSSSKLILLYTYSIFHLCVKGELNRCICFWLGSLGKTASGSGTRVQSRAVGSPGSSPCISPHPHRELHRPTIEEKRQRSSLLFEGQNLVNSLPR